MLWRLPGEKAASLLKRGGFFATPIACPTAEAIHALFTYSALKFKKDRDISRAGNTFNEKNMRKYNAQRGNAAAITIGVIIILALIAWAIFDDPDAELSTETNRATTTSDEMTQNLRDDQGSLEFQADNEVSPEEVNEARADARERLREVEQNLRLEANYEQAAAEVQDIESDLRMVYMNASAEVQQGWQEVQTNFDQLEDNLRQGTATALETFGGLILLLEAEVRTDEEE